MKSGLFNETFDTVLFRQGERDRRLGRFATELAYCLLHDEEVRLAEPHGADQALIIRLFEASWRRPEIREALAAFRIAQKPVFERGDWKGSVFFPLSVAQNILNSGYDCSSLSAGLECHRRLLTADWETRRTGLGQRNDAELVADGLRLLAELRKAEPGGLAENGVVLEYWERLLREGRNVLTRPAEERIAAWNSSPAHGFALLCEPCRTPARKPMGETVERVLLSNLERRPGTRKVLDGMTELTKNFRNPANLSPVALYFNSRSGFYVARDYWLKELGQDDFQFVKETVDTSYNLLVAHSCNARHNMFLPGEAGDPDYEQAQREVMDIGRAEVAVEPMGLVFDQSEEHLSWEAFLGLVAALGEATHDEGFLAARAAYVNEREAGARYQKLHSLAEEVNRIFNGRSVVMVLDTHAITLEITDPSGLAASMATYERVSEETHGETGTNPCVTASCDS